MADRGCRAVSKLTSMTLAPGRRSRRLVESDRTCGFHRIRLSTSPKVHPPAIVVLVRSVHGVGIFVPR
jgi:hypothetical protein